MCNKELDGQSPRKSARYTMIFKMEERIGESCQLIEFGLSQTKESYLKVKVKKKEKLYVHIVKNMETEWREINELKEENNWEELKGRGKCKIWAYTKDYDKEHNPQYYKVINKDGYALFYKRK